MNYPTIGRVIVTSLAAPLTIAAADISVEWTPSLTGALEPSLDGIGTAQLAAHPHLEDTAWACFGEIPSPIDGAQQADGCWRTDDWGESWRRLTDDGCTEDDFDDLCTTDNVLALAVCPHDGDTLAVATHRKGFFRSSDGGESWQNISDGIVYQGDGTEPGHCTAFGPSTFRDQSASSPWTATTVAFDPSDPTCGSLWGGIGHFAEQLLGSWKHPGVYLTQDSGETWAPRNGGDYELAQADGGCGSTYFLHSAMPSSLAFSDAGPVFLAVADMEQGEDWLVWGTAASRIRLFSLTDPDDTTWRELEDPLLASTVTPEYYSFKTSVSYGLLSVDGDTLVLSQRSFNQENSAGLWDFDTTDFVSTSEGLLVGEVHADGDVTLSTANAELPVVADEYNDAATNTSGVAISSLSGLWAVGLRDSDGADSESEDGSFVYVTLDSGSTWLNTSSFDVAAAMSDSPTQGLEESSIEALVWNATGTQLLASVRWYDRYQPEWVYPLPPLAFEADNGVYRTDFESGADLQVEKTAPDRVSAHPGLFAYSVSVTNEGPLTATGVTITDPLPNELDYVSHTTIPGYPTDPCFYESATRTVTCDLPSGLEESEAFFLSIVVEVR